MRILIDLQACQGGSQFRGIGRYAFAVVRALIEEGQGHTFHLLVSDRFPETIAAIRQAFVPDLPADAIVVCSLPPNIAAAGGENVWRTRAAEIVRHALIEQFAPDIVFVPALFEGFWDDMAISVEPDATYATAVTIHDLIPLENPSIYLTPDAARDAYVRRIQDARRAGLLIAISEYVGSEIVDRLGIERERVLVALNGVDARFRRPTGGDHDRADLMRRLGVARPFVFNTSPLESRKNLEGTIAAFASLPEAIRDGHQLVISGKFDDYGRTYLRNIAAAEGMAEDALVLTGYVSDDDLIGLYAECALYLFPAFSEGFGLPPLEAMACGAPVLVSNATSLPEVVGRLDLQVDPGDPQAIAATMARILTDDALQWELRAFGPQRAAMFDWRSTARRMLDAFAALVARRKDVMPQLAAPVPAGRRRIALVCREAAAADEMAGRLASLIPALVRHADVTLVTPVPGQVDPATAATVDCRDLEWLAWNAVRFDGFVYCGRRRDDERLAPLMAVHPGIFIEIPALVHARSSALSASDAPAGLRTAMRSGPAIALLTEGGDDLPPLPMVADGLAADAYRERYGIPPLAPLIVVIVERAATASVIVNAYRAVQGVGQTAHLVVHALARSGADGHGGKSLDMAGGVHHAAGALAADYRGLISAADVLLMGSDVPARLAERCMLDTQSGIVQFVDDADRRADVGAIIAATVARTLRRIAAPHGVVAPLPGAAGEPWAHAILARFEAAAHATGGQLRRIGRLLPAAVRHVRPDGQDLVPLTRAIEQNLAWERPKRVFFDISAFASPGATRRLDLLTRAQLGALLQRGGADAGAIYEHEGKFVLAHAFVANALDLACGAAADELLCVRSGDCIVGLDVLHGFRPGTAAALRAMRVRGARVAYVATGAFSRHPDGEGDLADLVYAFTSGIVDRQGVTLTLAAGDTTASEAFLRLPELLALAESADLPMAVFVAGGVANALPVLGQRHAFVTVAASAAVEVVMDRLRAGATRQDGKGAPLSYAIMGHIRGSYSLAIINRHIAATLEQAFPGRVRYLPFETDPAWDVDGVPVHEQPLMKTLMARPAPGRHREVVIAQHWPLKPPQDEPRLGLALFPWEESHVPPGIIETLNTGFDAVIAPSRSTASALLISGLTIPVAAIGQPVDLTPFHRLAEARAARLSLGAPLRFMHVSSCFPRKGVDVLLAAWARAFTAKDNVELVIKTFPNPHNDSEAQLRALAASHDIAPVRIINREADSDELLSYYADADVMVLPSRGEGYNLPALEAMAAGVPLIVTGHGGHRDFCGPEQARLLRFRFAYAASHVAGEHSMWVEPDAEDLAAALRELADPSHSGAIETRRRNALNAAMAEGDRSAWVRRLAGVVRDLEDRREATVPKIGWVSTWGVKCGIAQYSGYLLDHMSPAQRAAVRILCDTRTLAGEADIAHRPAWAIDVDHNDQPAADIRKAKGIIDSALEDGCKALLVQHQDGLISWRQLGRIGEDPRLESLASVAILHNARNLSRVSDAEELATIVRGLSRFSSVLAHNIDDLNYLVSLGLRENLNLFPHGAFAPRHADWPRKLGPGDAPVIGSHGFFFRHKGLDKLIRAAASLRRDWPALRLRLVNARFPGKDHEQFFNECVKLASELGMDDAIDWYPDFLPVEEIDALLAGCDLIVLPYGHSDDSASGAIRTSLASMVPLVATRVNIFAEFEGQVAMAETNDPADLVATIQPLLRSTRARREIQANIHEWLTAHDWRKVAATLETIVRQLVAEKQMGWGFVAK